MYIFSRTYENVKSKPEVDEEQGRSKQEVGGAHARGGTKIFLVAEIRGTARPLKMKNTLYG